MAERKRSWADIDNNKKSSARKPEKEKNATVAEKKALDSLFTGKDVPAHVQEALDKLKDDDTPEQKEWRAAVAELKETEGFREFAMAATKFHRAGHALPDDEDLLVRLLDHPNERVLCATLEHFIDLHRRRDLVRGTAIKNRLATIRAVAESPHTLKLSDDIEALL